MCGSPSGSSVLAQRSRQKLSCVVAQRSEKHFRFLESRRATVYAPPNKPAKVQLHFLNSTRHLSTIQPGIHSRKKMGLKSILMTPLPLFRGRLMPARQILLHLVLLNYFWFNLMKFPRKKNSFTWRQTPNLLEKDLQGHLHLRPQLTSNSRRSRSGWTGEHSAWGRLIPAKCPSRCSAVCRSWNAVCPINHPTSRGMPPA